jgi:site-specific recombinase XerD
LVQKGINLKVIQELLGHDAIQTTMIYAHLAPGDKRQAANVIGKVLLQ